MTAVIAASHANNNDVLRAPMEVPESTVKPDQNVIDANTELSSNPSTASGDVIAGHNSQAAANDATVDPVQRVLDALAVPAPHFVNNQARLQHLHDQAQDICDLCVKAPVKGIKKLHKKCKSELKFLNSLRSQTEEQLFTHLRSSNLQHLCGISQTVRTLPHVTEVLAAVYSRCAGHTVVVDAVCNHGYTWVKVIARKAQALHLVWAGCGQFGDKNIVDQARQYIICAEENKVHYKIPQVVFLFIQGITPLLQQTLEDTGVKVHGRLVEIDAETEEKLKLMAEAMRSDTESEEDCSNSDYDDDEEEDGHDDGGPLLSAAEWLLSQKKPSNIPNIGHMRIGNSLETDKSSAASGKSCNELGQSPDTCNKSCDVAHISTSACDKSAAVINKCEKTNCSDAQPVIDSLPSLGKMCCNDKTSSVDANCSNPGNAQDHQTEATTDVFWTRPDDIPRVNLDITTLICLVSNLCFGGCHYSFTEKILSEQAEQERAHPVLQEIQDFIQGKAVYVCESALSDFRNILVTVGGPQEQRRAEVLLSTVTVVPDQPSRRAAAMASSAKVKDRAKAIFGTGDNIQATTVTANVGFVRAARGQGVTFSVFLHESRALTELKEPHAKPQS